MSGCVYDLFALASLWMTAQAVAEVSLSVFHYEEISVAKIQSCCSDEFTH